VGLGIRPRAIVTVDGSPVSGVFFERLIKLSITDREGLSSDVLELEFSDTAPKIGKPRRGAVISVALSNGAGVVPMGSFVVNQSTRHVAPDKVTVRAHSSDLTAKMKEKRSKHWDGKTVRQIVEEKAGDHGLKARVSDAVSGHQYPWLGQRDESDLAFLNRLSQRHGALFTIKNGSLLWLERGTGKTASGDVIPPALIHRGEILKGTGRITETDVDRFAKVKAYWQDRAGAIRQEVVVDADPEAKGEHVIRDPFASQAGAKRAAQAKANEILQGVTTANCAIEGRPALMAGQPFSLIAVAPEADGREFIISMAKHSFSKSGGLRTELEGKLKLN
jgi:phage protein D